MNAKQELLYELKGRIPLAAIIVKGNEWSDDRRTIELKLGGDFEAFLSQLDFEYDNGYGGQELFGTVWVDDKVWLTRGEYDGSEWWQEHSYPAIPEELK